MKLKTIFGLITVALLTLNSCQKDEFEPLKPSINIEVGDYINKTLKDPKNHVLKDFGRIQTRSTLTPEWKDGNLICVFSLDEDNTIMYKDTCVIYNAQGSLASVKAEVHKECARYFAVYPFDYIMEHEGDMLNLAKEGHIRHTGYFGDENIMTAFCDKDDNQFDFETRYFLLKVMGIKNYNFPITIDFYKQDRTKITRTYNSFDGDYFYCALWYEELKCPKFEITYRKKNGGTANTSKTPKGILYPGHIYGYSF